MLRKLNGLPKRWLLVVAATALLSVGLTAGVIAAAGFDGAGAPIGGKTAQCNARLYSPLSGDPCGNPEPGWK